MSRRCTRGNSRVTMADGIHVVMLPYLAFGHMIPFLQLSVALAKAGIRVSFFSTPRNIQRLPKIPPNLTHLISLVELPLPNVDGLPKGVESTADILQGTDEYLKKALNLSYPAFERFIAKESPDWIIYDVNPIWMAKIARKYGVPSILFSIVSATVIAFLGSVESMIGDGLRKQRPSPESLTTPPEWFESTSSIAFPSHQAESFYNHHICQNATGVSDVECIGVALQGCDAIAIRSCIELEGEHFDLLKKLHQKPVIPVGILPPGKREISKGEWTNIFNWLDKQPAKSTVFVVFGSECRLSREQVFELAHGLELSNLPFIWALKRPIWAANDIDALPSQFDARIASRGIVCMGWVPQLEILAHPAIGGSLFHSGWGTVVETLQYGHVLVVLPLANVQGIEARQLVERGLAVEVERKEDGSLHRDMIARSLRRAMVEEEGENLRLRCKELKAILGDQKLHQDYLNGFINFLNKKDLPRDAQPK